VTAYKRQLAAAKRLIAAKGAKVTWRQPPDQTADPDKPWNAVQGDPVDFGVSIVFLPDTRKEFAALMKGTDVPEGAETGLMGAVEFEPQVGDMVIRNGSALRVVSLSPLQPDGVPLLYTIGFES